MKTDPVKLPEAGELLAIEALDRTGLAITSEGALVRILHVIPPNPLILSGHDRERIAVTFCHMAGRLRPGQSLQFYVQARPVNLDEVLAACRREVTAWAGDPPTADQPARDPLALGRWRLYASMEESLRLHADDQAAMQFNAYVVVPYLADQRSTRALLNELRPRSRNLQSGPLDRDLKVHRRAARESLAHTDAIRGELDSLSLPTRLLNGEEVAGLLWARFNPTAGGLVRAPRLRWRSRSWASWRPRPSARRPGPRPPSCAPRSRDRAWISVDRSTTPRSTATSSRRSTRPPPRTRPRWAG